MQHDLVELIETIRQVAVEHATASAQAAQLRLKPVLSRLDTIIILVNRPGGFAIPANHPDHDIISPAISYSLGRLGQAAETAKRQAELLAGDPLHAMANPAEHLLLYQMASRHCADAYSALRAAGESANGQ